MTIHGAAVVSLQPLDADTVADYLRQGGGPAVSGRWKPVLADLGTEFWWRVWLGGMPGCRRPAGNRGDELASYTFRPGRAGRVRETWDSAGHSEWRVPVLL